jgi:L-phenylalanine/L-methionine N-acetyltransferase
MDLVIRHVNEQDHEAVHEILISPHVLSGPMRVPFAPLQQTRERLTPTRGIYQLVAVAENRVVGFGELITYPDEPRHRHAGEINMVATHADWIQKGVGRALLDASSTWPTTGSTSPVLPWSSSPTTPTRSGSTNASGS